MNKRTTTAKPPRRVKAVSGYVEPTEETPIDGPVWELPRTAAAYDAMVEQMAKAKARSEGYRYTRFMYGYQDDARVHLRAIGISRPRDTSAQVRRKRNTTNSQEALDNAMADWVSSYPRD